MKTSIILSLALMLLTNICNAQNWIETAQSTLSDVDSENQYFGKLAAIDGDYSVDISGDNIIVGSYRDDENSQTVFHQKIIKE